MSYQVIKMIVYVVSVMLSMWSLSCFNFDNVIRKAKVREFYLFFLIASLCLGYLLGSFILYLQRFIFNIFLNLFHIIM